MHMLLLSFCCFLVVSAVAGAQQLPNPKPEKAHMLLAKDVGTWDCKVKLFFGGPDNPPMESTGTEVNDLVSGNLYKRTAFKCRIADRDFEGHALTGYDPRTRKYVGTWVDNFTSVPTQLTGEYDVASNTFTAYSTVVDAASNQELKQKQVTTWIDASHKKFEIFQLLNDATGEGIVEIKLMEMMANKRKVGTDGRPAS